MRAWLEGKTDFEGQKRAERVQHYLLISITVLSFVIGFVAQSLWVTFVILGTGTAVVALLTIPAWPIYNRHPLSWKSVPAKETRKER